MAKEWFYQLMGAELGPVSSAELKRKADQGQIEPETLVRAGPDGKWLEAARVKGLIDLPPAPPQPAHAEVPAHASVHAHEEDRTYHFTGDSGVDVASQEEPASGEYDFFQMVGFELALGTPLHRALVERCRTQHVTMTEVTRRALAEHLGREDLLEEPEPPQAGEPG